MKPKQPPTHRLPHHPTQRTKVKSAHRTAARRRLIGCGATIIPSLAELSYQRLGLSASAHVTAKEAMVLSRLRRGSSVREAWTNRGRVLRRLGEQNAGRAYGPHRLAAVPQFALSGGSSKSHDLLPALHFAYRSDIRVRPATFGRLHFPSILSAKRLRPSERAVPCAAVRSNPTSSYCRTFQRRRRARSTVQLFVPTRACFWDPWSSLPVQHIQTLWCGNRPLRSAWQPRCCGPIPIMDPSRTSATVAKGFAPLTFWTCQRSG